MKITVTLSTDSIGKAAKALHEYAESLNDKTSALVDAIGAKGTEFAVKEYDLGHNAKGGKLVDTGNTLASIAYEKTGEKSGSVSVGGAAVWIEFGTGVTHNAGSGHPKKGDLGMSDWGTYGKGHGADPNGWWYKKDNGWHHTYGIEMNPFMYNTSQDLRRELVTIAREVFKK